MLIVTLLVAMELLPAPRLHAAAFSAALRPFVRDVSDEVVPAWPVPVRIRLGATTEPVLGVTSEGGATVRVGAGLPATAAPPVAFTGPMREAYTVETRGRVGLRVRFAPVGPLAVLGVRYDGGGASTPRALCDVVRPDLAAAARRYQAAVLDAPDAAARVRLTERFLLDALAGQPAADAADAAFLDAVVGRIEAAGGCLRIADLARQAGVSASTLRRRFRVLGLSVKRFADVVRFRQSDAYLRATAGASWADAVAEFGYCDQSHYLRTRRRFSDTPPHRSRDARPAAAPAALGRFHGVDA